LNASKYEHQMMSRLDVIAILLRCRRINREVILLDEFGSNGDRSFKGLLREVLMVDGGWNSENGGDDIGGLRAGYGQVGQRI
jgi:hypothetical protein